MLLLNYYLFNSNVSLCKQIITLIRFWKAHHSLIKQDLQTSKKHKAHLTFTPRKAEASFETTG